tara:strand:- start:9423 stop:10385 length:963 start_codon:yes stop_codon:yes gene_type:complete
MAWCIYLTVYLGSKMPPFYLGSTSVARIKAGYRGSVSSYKWRSIWIDEITNNPSLFKTFIVQYILTKEKKLKYEELWQKAFQVVTDEWFLNQSFANKNFTTTPETTKKALDTKRRRGTTKHSNVTKLKMSIAAKNRSPVSQETKEKLSRATQGRKHSEEAKANMRRAQSHRPPVSEETKKKISKSKLGKKVPKHIVDKRADKLRGRKASIETRLKQSQAQKGKPKTQEHKENISKSRQGFRWFTNGIIDQQAFEPPGPEWSNGRTRISSAKGKNNGNATTVQYNCEEYGTVKEAVEQTGLSRHLLIKYGAIFQSNPIQIV